MALLIGTRSFAQSIQPVILEYTEKADGKFELTNDTLTPMAVVLEPKSFDITADGRGVYRPLDAKIHIELSSMSFRLEPKQSYYVFYKAHADTLPAWFTVYATFSPIRSDPGLKVRMMLPHTVYLYQKKALNREAIQVKQAIYQKQQDTITCDLENNSPSLVRVQEVRVVGDKTAVLADGFPLLPESQRHLEIAWKQKGNPDYLLLHFPHFDVKETLSIENH